MPSAIPANMPSLPISPQMPSFPQPKGINSPFSTPVKQISDVPLDMDNLLSGMQNPQEGMPITDRDATMSKKLSEEQKLKEEISATLESFTQQTGCFFSIKNFEIHSEYDPASIAISISCKAQKGDLALAKCTMLEIYTTIQKQLVEHISTTNEIYKNSTEIPNNEQQEYLHTVQQLLDNNFKNLGHQASEILSFQNNRPIISIPPSISKSDPEKLLNAIHNMFAKTKTMIITFIGTLDIDEDHKEDDTQEHQLDIQAKARKASEVEESVVIPQPPLLSAQTPTGKLTTNFTPTPPPSPPPSPIQKPLLTTNNSDKDEEHKEDDTQEHQLDIQAKARKASEVEEPVVISQPPLLNVQTPTGKLKTNLTPTPPASPPPSPIQKPLLTTNNSDSVQEKQKEVQKELEKVLVSMRKGTSPLKPIN